MTFSKKHFSDTIYIAAADSSEIDKQLADFVCSGIHDQDILQQAVDSISHVDASLNNDSDIKLTDTPKDTASDNTKNIVSDCKPSDTPTAAATRGKRLVLLPGNYYISAFPKENECGKAAVLIGSDTNEFKHIAILICGSEHTESTTIHVTRACYEQLEADKTYSIFACSEHNWNHHVFKDLYVTVPDDQKNIICFDGRLMGSMGLSRCKCICMTKGNYGSPKTPLPVEGFVAFMGTYGSNNMWQEKWEFCQAEGFGQGFAVGSEHLLMHKCAALFGRYGYTFNNYPCDFGAIVHPITLLNCIDEANANMWKLAPNKYRQCINAYNTTFEHVPEWFALGGQYATEEHPGDYVGHIDFVGNQGFYTLNDPALQFWAKGSGKNFETVNNTHKKVCTTAERLSYAANIGQEVFDTDLMKKLTYIDYGVWADACGNIVE